MFTTAVLCQTLLDKVVKVTKKLNLSMITLLKLMTVFKRLIKETFLCGIYCLTFVIHKFVYDNKRMQ